MEFYPINSLKVERSKSSLGKYVIKLSETWFQFFTTKEQADRWLCNVIIHGLPEFEEYQAYCD